mgnify:FL=1
MTFFDSRLSTIIAFYYHKVVEVVDRGISGVVIVARKTLDIVVKRSFTLGRLRGIDFCIGG